MSGRANSTAAQARELAAITRRVRERIENGGAGLTAVCAALRSCLGCECTTDTLAQTLVMLAACGREACEQAANASPLLAGLLAAVRERPLWGDASASVEALEVDSRDVGHELYEAFLKEYDRGSKQRQGVFYTPEPVVAFIVRAADQLMRTEWGLADGLASALEADLSILDPAVGAGAFLLAVIGRVHESLETRWAGEGRTAAEMRAAWGEYVRGHLLPRLFGFELTLPAWALSLVNVARCLRLTGCRLHAGDRLNLYPANALEPPVGTMFDATAPDWIAREAERAGQARTRRFPIVLGNPPYSNYGLSASDTWIRGLLRDYKRGLGEKKLNLDDDFIKFVRLAQWHAQGCPRALVGLITNNTYLDGITHRRMRGSLCETFGKTFVLDLHGSVSRKDHAGGEAGDENVFEIAGVGAAIALFLRAEGARAEPAVFHHGLRGTRALKLETLACADVATIPWERLDGLGPEEGSEAPRFFVPKRLDGRAEYERGWPLTRIFRVWGNGIKTDRDALFVDFEREALAGRMRAFYSDEGLTPAFRKEFGVRDSSSYKLLARRAATTFDPGALIRCTYRPFDARWLYYAPGLTSRPAWAVVQHLLAGENVAFVSSRMVYGPAPWRDVFATCRPTEFGVMAARPGNSAPLFPLYLYAAGDGAPVREPNIVPAFLGVIEARAGAACSPAEAFNYIYALLHSTSFRARYAELLKIDFARVPVVGDAEALRGLCAAGARLVALHTGEREGDAGELTDREVAGGCPRYEGGCVRINDTSGFEGVTEDVWNYHVGGYQVCRKWLRDRRRRALSEGEASRFRGLIETVAETITVVGEIDGLVEACGGWGALVG